MQAQDDWAISNSGAARDWTVNNAAGHETPITVNPPNLGFVDGGASGRGTESKEPDYPTFGTMNNLPNPAAYGTAMSKAFSDAFGAFKNYQNSVAQQQNPWGAIRDLTGALGDLNTQPGSLSQKPPQAAAQAPAPADTGLGDWYAEPWKFGATKTGMNQFQNTMSSWSKMRQNGTRSTTLQQRV